MPPPVIAPKAAGQTGKGGSMEKPKANASADMAL
jgi:malate dehydrogenase (quinone)